MKDKCLYLEAVLEEVGVDVDMSKPCFEELSRKLKVKASRGFCERCKKLVAYREFSGPSVGSLTDIKIEESSK